MSLALSIICRQYIPVNAQERNDWKYEPVSDETVSAAIVVEENADGQWFHFAIDDTDTEGYVYAIYIAPYPCC